MILPEEEVMTIPSSEGSGQPEMYLTVSQLATLLGGSPDWPRTNVYYWLKRCQIPTVMVAGRMLIPVNQDLKRIVMTLKAAKEEAQRRRGQALAR